MYIFAVLFFTVRETGVNNAMEVGSDTVVFLKQPSYWFTSFASKHFLHVARNIFVKRNFFC